MIALWCELVQSMVIWDAGTTWTVHPEDLGAVQSLGILFSTEFL